MTGKSNHIVIFVFPIQMKQKMLPEIEIIPCDFENPGHCNALASLMNEYITDPMGGGQPYTAEQKEILVNGLKNHSSRIILLAKSDESYIGLMNSFINFATFTLKPFINIHDIIVTRHWRNKGVGRLLLKHIIEEARKRNCSKLTLEVREDNANAIHLYNSLGFLDAVPRQYYLTKMI